MQSEMTPSKNMSDYSKRHQAFTGTVSWYLLLSLWVLKGNISVVKAKAVNTILHHYCMLLQTS